jgi:PDZ domain-containing secreted protein
MIIIELMTEFFYDRFGKEGVGSLKGSSEQSVIEAFSDPKEYNQKYVDQAAIGCSVIENGCDDSQFNQANCLCTYKSNAQKYDKLTIKNHTRNGGFGDSKEKHSEIIISNINLGIGIVLMMSYVYSLT